jgi:hypothetical protein
MHKVFIASLTLLAGCNPGGGDPPLPSGNTAIVLTSGGFGAGGAVNSVGLADHKVTTAIDTSIDQDNAIRIADGKAWVLNRTPGSLFVYDTASWKAPIEIPTGDATAVHNTSDPQDVLPLAGTTRAYVTLLLNDGAHAVGVVDTTQPAGVTKWIAIPAGKNDTDGKPEPGALYRCDDRVYVLTQDYDETTYLPTAGGRMVVIDPSKDAVVDTIQLTGENPSTIAAESGDCNDVLVAASGPFGAAPDGTGGIERVDLAKKQSLGFIMKDTDINGRPSSINVVSKTLAFMTIFFDLEPQPMGPPALSSSKVVTFDPTSGKLLGDVTDAAAFISFATVTPDGQLFVGVDFYAGSTPSTKLAAGVYAGKADGKKLQAPPLDLGQNPYAIAFQ